MIITLRDTNSAEISTALLQARRSAGSPAMGMVLTLIIQCTEETRRAALRASEHASREHPSRVLLVVTSGGRAANLDARVSIGEGNPGEVVEIRMTGAVARHPASVIRPLLLPDSPVVVWWPGKAPADTTGDGLGAMANRRITDAMGAPRPMMALNERADHYHAGDTDLTWTRLTPWRALLAAALDQYPAKIKKAQVEAEGSNASARLLAAWLQSRLKVDVTERVSEGPGITAVRLSTAAGDIALTRQDGLLASYAVPGQPNRLVALKRRETHELLSEELRRMDADDILAQALKALQRRRRKASAPRTAQGRNSRKKATAQKTGTTNRTKKAGTSRAGTKRTTRNRTGSRNG